MFYFSHYTIIIIRGIANIYYKCYSKPSARFLFYEAYISDCFSLIYNSSPSFEF